MCNEQRECYNNRRIGKMQKWRFKSKSARKLAQFLQDRERKFHEATTRLQMNISFEQHLYHVFYHNSCYIKFVIKKKITVNKDNQMENLQNDIDKFLLCLKKRVIHQKDAFLLSHLLVI